MIVKNIPAEMRDDLARQAGDAAGSASGSKTFSE
jgi:hypothetical protein